MKRDCQCPRARHEHGTRQAYISDGCRCDECRAAHSAAKNRRVRLRAYGQLPPKSIPVIGTRRRIAALMTQGWPVNTLSRMCGWNPNRIHIYMTNDGGISPANARKIAELYDELWDKKPPRNTRHERSIYARTVNFAAARGYLPPLAWDEDTIDRPDIVQMSHFKATRRGAGEGPEIIDEVAVDRAMHGERVPLTKAEMSRAVATLTDMGYSADMTAQRLHIDRRTVQRYRAKEVA